jgi:FkbM family methyltransferase
MQIVDIASRAGSARVIVRDPKEVIQGRAWMKGRFWEDRLLEYIYWHYKSRVFVDIGSAHGNHTLFFAKFCEPSKVISVEPVPSSADHQMENLRLNGVQNKVVLHRCALSDVPGRGSMVPREQHVSLVCGSHTLKSGNEVEVITLDMLMDGVKHVNLVKIDVEGHELEVLKGGEEFIARQRPALFLEVLSKGHYNRVSEWLKQFGYNQVGSAFQDSRSVEFTVT